MKIRNRPNEYLKRSELPGRTSYVKKCSVLSEREPKKRDFTNVEIDSHFYFSFPYSKSTKKK